MKHNKVKYYIIKIFISVFFVQLSLISEAQQNEILKLEEEYKNAAPEQKAGILLLLSKTALDSSLELSLRYAEKALPIVRKQQPNDTLECYFMEIIGDTYFYNQNYRKAIRNYELANDLNKNFLSKYESLHLLYKIGSSYKNLGKIRKGEL